MENEAGKMSFEEALMRLEAIVAQLEGGQLSLEESLRRFEEGMALSKVCGDKLSEAESKIEVLIKNTDGSFAWTDFAKGNNA